MENGLCLVRASGVALPSNRCIMGRQEMNPALEQLQALLLIPELADRQTDIQMDRWTDR